MALVVLLKGVNVGGYRTFRPSVLAKELKQFDVVNIGAAGTFVVRRPGSRAKLRSELERRLPFETDVMICDGADIVRLTAGDPFLNAPDEPNLVRFVSVLAKRTSPVAALPLNLPASGEWGLRLLHHDGQFVAGVYRRQMRAVSYLALIEKIFGMPATTRNWNTIQTIARTLGS